MNILSTTIHFYLAGYHIGFHIPLVPEVLQRFLRYVGEQLHELKSSIALQIRCYDHNSEYNHFVCENFLNTVMISQSGSKTSVD